MAESKNNTIDKVQLITMNKKQILLKATLISLPLVLLMLVITIISVTNYKLSVFAKSAGIGKRDFIESLKSGWQQSPTATNNHVNFLILGLDSLNSRGNSTPLTDTLMLVSVDLASGKIVTLPLPRDLWSENYQTKINALYTYGLDRYPQQPEKFSADVIAQLTAIPIHHTVVISMETVSQLVDLIGGIEVEIEQGFIDEQFPRTEVDVTVATSPSELYETIEFKPGKKIMNGQTALKYMRSRHGNNDQNTDDARSLRQQVIIKALASKLFNPNVLLDTQLSGYLYRYYLDNFESSIAAVELLSIGKNLLPIRNAIMLENKSIKVYPDDQTGTIEHPPQYLYDGQWVYTIRDEDEFEQDIYDQLFR